MKDLKEWQKWGVSIAAVITFPIWAPIVMVALAVFLLVGGMYDMLFGSHEGM